MPFDDEVEVKPKGSAAAADLETDDCAVEFGDEDALSRSGLQKIMPADKTSYVRTAALTDVVKPRMAWMHFIQVGDKKHAYRCLSTRDKKHNIISKGLCCQKLENDQDQRAQLNFAVLGLKYKNANPIDGKYKKQADDTFPPVIWELGWIKLSQSGFKSISELVQQEDGEEAHTFDFAISYRDNGIGFKYNRVSQKARFRGNPELLAEVLEEAKKFADGAFLVKQLGKKVTELDMKAILSGKAAAGAPGGATKQVDNTDDL